MLRCVGRFDNVHRRAARDGFVDVRTFDLPRRTLTDNLRSIGWGTHLPGIWVPDKKKVSYAVRCRAAVAYVGGPVLLTGASALLHLAVVRQPPDKVELLLPTDRWIKPRGGLCPHYTTGFASIQAVPCDGMRLAWAARALADYAAHAGVSVLCRAIADATRLRHCTLAQVGAELHARRSFRGRAKLGRAYGELSGELNHSSYEEYGRRLLREAGEDVPPRPMPVVHNERDVAEVDLPWHDLRYGVEIDGPPHLLPEVAAKDRARDRMLARLCGWTIDRYLWFELEEQPERFVREVTDRLRRLREGR
jgi:hypothetical protein